MRSPNQSDRHGHTPEVIVIHVTLGSYDGAVSWLMNPQSGVSAHFVIGRKGQMNQLVDLDRAAYHAGRINSPNERGKRVLKKSFGVYTNPNWYTIGIENEALTENDLWTEKQMKKLTNTIRSLIRTYDIPKENIIIHKDITIDKPSIEAWRKEVLLRLDEEKLSKKLEKSVIYKLKSSPRLYLRNGKVLHHYDMPYERFKVDYPEYTLIELTKREFKKFNISENKICLS